MTDLSLLSKKFDTHGQLSFTEENEGFVTLHVDNDFATAEISLYAGQIMSYRPKGEDIGVLFKSDNIEYLHGRALRGGVPICWPWFGNDYSDYGRPPHGFARNQSWQLVDSNIAADGSTIIALVLTHTDQTLAVWPQRFNLRLTITIGKTLTLSLTTRNIDKKQMTVSQALHTYFKVGNIEDVEILGLEGKPYLDKLEDFAHKNSNDSITVSEEIDRVYQQVDSPVELIDRRLKRKIIISSKGSNTTVLWNPWQSSTKNIQDLSDHSYEEFVCVETANTADDLVVIQPGENHTMATTYTIENL